MSLRSRALIASWVILAAACTNGDPAAVDDSVDRSRSNIDALAYASGSEWVSDDSTILARIGRQLQVMVTLPINQNTNGSARITDSAHCNATTFLYVEGPEGLKGSSGGTTEKPCSTSLHDQDIATYAVLSEVSGARVKNENLVLEFEWGEVLLHETPDELPLTAGGGFRHLPPISWSAPGDSVPEIDDLGLRLLAPSSGPDGETVAIDLQMVVRGGVPSADVAVRWNQDDVLVLGSAEVLDGGIFTCFGRHDGAVWAETEVRGVAACEYQPLEIYFLIWEENGSLFHYSSTYLTGSAAKAYLGEW